MFDKIKGFLSKKLMAVILTPVLTAILIAVNGILPTPLSQEEITKIVTYLIGLIAAYVLGQSGVDAVKANNTTPNATQTTTTTNSTGATGTTKKVESIESLNI